MDSVEDIYKAIGNELNNSLNYEWDKIELTIECSNDYVGTSAKYQINGEWKNNFDCDLTRDTMVSIIKFHNNAGKINFTPWNKAVYKGTKYSDTCISEMCATVDAADER